MGKSYSQKVRSRSGRGGGRSSGGKGSNEKDADAPFPWAPVIVIGIVLALIIGAVAYYQVQNGDEGGDEGSNDGNNGGGNNGNNAAYPYLSIPLESTDSGIIQLKDYSGKVVVVDMFATWCSPCRQMMVTLNEFREMFDPSDVVILSIDTDLRETLSQVSDFKSEFDAEWTFATSSEEFNGYFPAQSIPTLYVLDGSGKQVETHVGAGINSQQLADLIAPYIGPA